MVPFHNLRCRDLVATIVATLFATVSVRAQQHGESQAPGEDPHRISDQYVPLQVEGFPIRPQPLLELGNPFLGTGPIAAPFHSPTGQLLTPTLLAWGSVRSGYSLLRRENNKDRTVWANRIDLFFEGRLSPTERVVVGLQPLNKNGVFSGYDFEQDKWLDGTNLDLSTAFFEGDFGEIFPGLDRGESHALDYGFGVGRQPVTFQDGIMINDVMDSVTVTRNSLRFAGMSNFLATGLFAWNGIDRGNSVRDDRALLFGLMTASDFEWSYIQIDGVFVKSDNQRGGDGFFFGVGGTQRFGEMNSTLRVNTSTSLDKTSTPANAFNAPVSDGVLATAQLSWTPHETEDNFYVSGFAAMDKFTSASRAPATGGPLTGMGILFAATGLGAVGAPLGSTASDIVGGAIGYQQFLDHANQQLIYEIGGRASTRSDRKDSTVAVGTRYQTLWGQHAVFLVDVFAGYDQIDNGFIGSRLEFQWKL